MDASLEDIALEYEDYHILGIEGKPESLEIALIHRQRMLARHLILTECRPLPEETLERENHLLNPESHD